jgi:uncharacterized protein (TIGR02300 family)
MQPPSTRKATLIKPELGTKRVCPSCSARFYDLQKRPIECPKCSFEFEPEALLKQRRARLPEEVKEKAQAATEDEEELERAEGEEAAEATGDEEELEGEDAVAAADEPMVEADIEAEDEDAEASAETEAVEPEEFEEDLEGEEDEDDELLEEVEEDEDDVSGIIDTDIEKDEP